MWTLIIAIGTGTLTGNTENTQSFTFDSWAACVSQAREVITSGGQATCRAGLSFWSAPRHGRAALL